MTQLDFGSRKSIHNSSTDLTFGDEFMTTTNPFINLKYSIRFGDPTNENQNIQKYSEQKNIAYSIVTTGLDNDCH